MINPPPCLLTLKWFGKILGSNTADFVKIGDKYLKIRGYFITYHDLHHLEASCLDRVQIGRHMVSGIHGINSDMFHDSPIVEEYDGILDEIRVVFHQWISRPSLFTTLKGIFWMFWIILYGLNSIAIVFRLVRASKHREDFYKLAENMIFVSSNEFNEFNVQNNTNQEISLGNYGH
ncbi:MAG: hypothetical protein KME60_14130 [Cyanomargarita calcarea GSE-NOS-MK-12-04C]|jgi:hypothetical protein|uniref:Transmembrane protein n=1 Tax=Cyanomargarita calcarea GSE-NOS-MK-12-04C TaxID=2839659 RepID=A0A951QM73_9CYAN|nr:hypothetical protein [Cyanomargarita calcarea GSE-NOS-MK-12-04C]